MSESASKRVPVRERAITIGKVIGINAYRANRTLLKERFAEGGYQVLETNHFLLFTREQAPAIIVAHWFAPAEIDANIGDYFLQELKPSGILNNSQDFGDLFGAIVLSISPSNTQQALQRYAANTLREYHSLIDGGGSSLPHRPMNDFAMLYKRVRELVVGESLLDAGCSFGFLPLLMAEYLPSLKRIAGIDIQTDSFPIVRAIAAEKRFHNVEFVQADLLSDIVEQIGHFDTLVALHVLEHFSEVEMYRVLTNLLKVAIKRLIIAVPYEEEPEIIYDHKQIFSRQKLEAVGQWCIEQFGEESSMWCEERAGGVLVIDKPR